MKKKFISLFIIFVLMLNMMLPGIVKANISFDDTYTITINNGVSGHTYEIYQIFQGVLSSDGKLTNIEWGTGVTDSGVTALGDATAKAEELSADGADAKAFALEVSKYLSTTKVDVVIDDGNTATVEAGYYLIKDKDDSLDDKTGEAYTAYILKVAADVSVTPKTGVPTLVHKVKDYNDTTSTTGDWHDSADYDMGDTVEFKLDATVASNYTSYDSYKLVIHNTLDDGFTFDADSVSIYTSEGLTYSSNVFLDFDQFVVDEVGNTFTITITDLSDVVCLDKTFKSADCGITNNSTLTIYYNATLDTDANVGSTGNSATAYMEYSNNPNNSAKNGKTVDDKVKVFTYEVEVNKVDSSNNSLTGAMFKLEKKLSDGTTKEVTVVGDTTGSTFTFTGLDDGDYVLTETVTPDGYNTITPVEFTVTASHDTSSDDATLTALTAETTVGTATWTTVLAAGTLTTQIVNKSGSFLPSTGGVGALIFIVLGIALMGFVIFVVIKRKNKEDK